MLSCLDVGSVGDLVHAGRLEIEMMTCYN